LCICWTSKAIQEAGIPEADLEAGSDDFLETEVFEKDPRQIQAQARKVKVSTNMQTPVRIQPVATLEQFRVRPVTDLQPIPLDLATQDNLGDNIAEQVESGLGPVAAPVPQQPRHRIMAEDRVLLPQPFSSSAEEDPAEFWRRLEPFMIYKGMKDADKLKLTKAMLVGAAQDWIEALDSDKKNTMVNLKTSFSDRFIQPPVLRFRSAYDMFQKKQAETESVDAYANRLRSLAKRIDINDATLLYAFVSGLKGKLASFVLGENPTTLEAAINDARIAEMSLGDQTSGDSGFLS